MGSAFGQAFPPDELPFGQEFGVRTTHAEDSVWMALAGELDVFATPSLRSALRAAEATKPSLLVLDLRGLRFLDSSGLAVLLGAHERAAAEAGRTVKLVISGSRTVESLFATLRAGDFLDIEEDPRALVGAHSA